MLFTECLMAYMNLIVQLLHTYHREVDVICKDGIITNFRFIILFLVKVVIIIIIVIIITMGIIIVSVNVVQTLFWRAVHCIIGSTWPDMHCEMKGYLTAMTGQYMHWMDCQNNAFRIIAKQGQKQIYGTAMLSLVPG